MEAKLRHLEMVQSVINRMASNSFQLKGWSVVLVSALLVLVSEKDSTWLLISLVPTLVFWGLDAYFLCQERRYRRLYDHVCKLEPDKINFSMATSCFSGRYLTWFSSFRSITLVPFYLALVAGVVAVAVISAF